MCADNSVTHEAEATMPINKKARGNSEESLNLPNDKGKNNVNGHIHEDKSKERVKSKIKGKPKVKAASGIWFNMNIRKIR